MIPFRFPCPAAWLIVTVLAAGCMTLEINYDYDREADFSRFETYSWESSEATVEDDDPLLHDRIISAIDEQLRNRDLQLVASDPDLLVIYHAESESRIVLDRVGYYDRWYWSGMSVSTTRARSYEQGTLVVDLVDAAANRLVWRGIATDTVSTSPSGRAQQIQTATQQMFRRYPPG